MWSNLKLIHKGLILVGVPLLFQIAFLCVMSAQVHQAEVELDRFDSARRMAYLANKLIYLNYECGYTLGQYALTNKRVYRDRYDQAIKELPVTSKKLVELSSYNPRERKLMDEISGRVSAAYRLFRDAQEVMEEGGGLAMMMRLRPMRAKLTELGLTFADKMRGYVRMSQANAEKSLKTQRDLRKRQVVFLVGAFVFNIALAFALVAFFARTTTQRLSVVTDNAERLSRGESLNPTLSGTDEIAYVDREFHRMAAALNDAYEKERAVVRNARDVICSLNKDFVFERVNPASFKLWGYEPEELIGMPLDNLIVDSEWETTKSAFISTMSGAPDVSIENQIKHKDGPVIDALWSVYWSESDEQLFCVAHDITERKQIERLKQDFVSMVTHDLRTPLTSVRGLVVFLLRGTFGELPEKASRKLESIDGNLNRLIGLINDLLDIEKLDAGQMPMDMAPVSATSVAERSIQSVDAYAQGRGVKLVSKVEDVEVVADGDRIVQVVVNFLSNAIKFSPEGGVVELAVALTDDRRWLEIKVTDQGRGVPKELHKAIFERYQQVSKKDAKRKAGTGLGLAICKLIVESHDGQIGVDSEEGAGSTFWFRLPAGEENGQD